MKMPSRIGELAAWTFLASISSIVVRLFHTGRLSDINKSKVRKIGHFLDCHDTSRKHGANITFWSQIKLDRQDIWSEKTLFSRLWPPPPVNYETAILATESEYVKNYLKELYADEQERV